MLLSTTLNHCLIRPFFPSYVTKRIRTTKDSSEFRTEFLKNKCGLSGKSLITACKNLTFDSSNTRPDSVLHLFRTFGFTQPNITRIFSMRPRFLQYYSPENVFKPKLDFLLNSMDLTQAEVVFIVTQNPSILHASLSNCIIPSLKTLQSVAGNNCNAVAILKSNPYVLTNNPRSFLLNTNFLLTLNVPHSQTLKFLKASGRLVGIPHNKSVKLPLFQII